MNTPDPAPPAASPPAHRGFLGWLCRIIPWQPTIKELSPGMTVEMKAELIAQEHRLLPIVRNALAYGRLPPEDARHQAAFTAGLWRLVTSAEAQTIMVAGGGGLVAIFGIILTLQSVRIAERQEKQALIQNALAEANRMALLHTEVTALATEIAEAINPADTDVFARVRTLCNVLEPYRTLKWDGHKPELSERLSNRERGELFLACAKTDLIDPNDGKPTCSSYCDIDFSYADLSGQDLDGVHIRKCRLSASDLSESTLYGAEAAETDLENANFGGAYLHYVDFNAAMLEGAQFEGARLTNINFEGAVLPDADNFRGAYWFGVSLGGATVRQSDWLKRMEANGIPGFVAALWELRPHPADHLTGPRQGKDAAAKLNQWRARNPYWIIYPKAKTDIAAENLSSKIVTVADDARAVRLGKASNSAMIARDPRHPKWPGSNAQSSNNSSETAK